MTAIVEEKAKALAGALVTAIVSYAALALQQGTALTLHGLEAAAVGAVVGFLGVHQAPANKKRAKAVKDAGLTVIEVLVVVLLILVILALLGYGIHH